MVFMTQVSVSELKSQLSRYLREVRRGGEIQILDRGRPVARLTGLPGPQAEPADERRERLIRAGILRPGRGNIAQFLEEHPPLKLSIDLSAALQEEREDRI